MLCKFSSKSGFILIMVLWVLGFLTVLAVTVGLGTRQKIMLLGRLEDRSQAQLSAEAGVKKAVAVLADDLENNQFMYSPQAKARRHDNPAEFSNIIVGDEIVDVSCSFYDETSGGIVNRYGACDEQGKININVVDRETLARLMIEVLFLTTNDGRKLSDVVVDWRDFGRHEAEGFFSEDYYTNLEYPYEMKEQPFERIDELLLVKGFNKDIYEKLRPYLTIYGDGRININTASQKVLIALGLDPALVDKILKVRRGVDGKNNTADDHVFFRAFDIASEVGAFVPLEEKETRQIDALNGRNLLRVDSMLFSAASRVYAPTGDLKRVIEIVFNGITNRLEYWHEK